MLTKTKQVSNYMTSRSKPMEGTYAFSGKIHSCPFDMEQSYSIKFYYDFK